MGFGDKAIEHTERKIVGLYALLQSFTGLLESYAKEHASWVDRTGHARQGIHAGVEDHGEEIVLYLAHGKEYGSYLETGTGIHGPQGKPYKIVPKDKKALFWTGAPHPVNEVLHPGMKAHPIIAPAIDVHIPRIRKNILDYWED
ncbi:hypothetical protein Dtox_4238 [Desulfofarcimen acetoxidans DSM 771]|uniref:Phage protein, HK97 gp10 family n=1 Tax=Desulfofarcimen acetoxidans (strain ATCC 49208 / DSM 771 / KCTC 5769 / VKM B-1644 / 5575) TaxID=485916 RepID=C8VZG0_DESAS|nr:hypothetical protein [Desulfofarcimen acetoxidans]ACV64905.1 hypothetical protein Dtox_4238 [Desulfofarcimen acetoxidans DSM 771]